MVTPHVSWIANADGSEYFLLPVWTKIGELGGLCGKHKTHTTVFETSAVFQQTMIRLG